MTRRRRLRRRLLWAGVLLGLVLLVAALSVLDAALGVRDQVVADLRARRTEPKGEEDVPPDCHRVEPTLLCSRTFLLAYAADSVGLVGGTVCT